MYEWKKTIHLIRGLPGSGKTTLALSLVNNNNDQVAENDHYQTINGVYSFDFNFCELSAQWCLAETFRKLRTYDEVAVANTFVQMKYILPYIKEAAKRQVKIILHTPKTDWFNDINECYQKNVHDVPMENLLAMEMKWEDITQNEIDQLLGYREVLAPDFENKRVISREGAAMEVTRIPMKKVPSLAKSPDPYIVYLRDKFVKYPWYRRILAWNICDIWYFISKRKQPYQELTYEGWKYHNYNEFLK
jgi:hypothetical protein